jgi:signal transduction histidine kinase
MNRENTSLYTEIEERSRFETLLIDLSLKFVNLPAGEVDREILDAERRLCELLGLDIVALWQWSAGAPDSFTATHYYSVQNGPQPPMGLSENQFPWVKRQMLAGRIVAISSLKEMPAEAAHDREVCRQMGIKSNLCLPLAVGGKPPIGILGLNTTQAERDWPEAVVNRLQVVAQVFANAMARKRAEEALFASESLLQAGAELAGLGCYEVNFNERSCHVDDRFHEICGVPAGQQSGLLPVQLWMDQIHPDDRQRVLDHRDKLHDGKLDRLSIEYRYLHPTQGEKWIHHTARVAARDAAGHAIRSFGAIRDVTSRKKAERETQELRDNLAHVARVTTVGALSSSLAHELNQPLGIILSNAQAAQELLAQQPPDLAEVQSILTDIVAADRRAGDIIAGLREMLKHGPIPFHPLLLNQIIEDVLHLIQSDLIRRGITVIRHLATDLPPIAGDRVQLQQLMLNLIINGADAMASNDPGTRRLHVQTMLHGGRVHASVRDEGTGLPADTNLLFQPFYTTKPQGLGLGLHICQAIVATHHGRLWAESHPERGAVFCFELPASESVVHS